MPDFGARTVERGARHFAVELFFAAVIAAVVVGLDPGAAATDARDAEAGGTDRSCGLADRDTVPIAGACHPFNHLGRRATGALSHCDSCGWFGDVDRTDLCRPNRWNPHSCRRAIRALTSHRTGCGCSMAIRSLRIRGRYSARCRHNSSRPHFLQPGPTTEAHLCEMDAPIGGPATATLVEFDETGHARVVATLGPTATVTGSWQVLACSPSADRAVVMSANSQSATLIVLHLSTGRVIARHSFGDAAWGIPIASHGGSVVALNEPSGVTIRNSITWAVLGYVVRWGSQEGYPLIGAAVDISWDGSRIVVDGGGAAAASTLNGWLTGATDRTLLTNTGTGRQAIGVPGFDDAIPLTIGTGFFLPPGDIAVDRRCGVPPRGERRTQEAPGLGWDVWADDVDVLASVSPKCGPAMPHAPKGRPATTKLMPTRAFLFVSRYHRRSSTVRNCGAYRPRIRKRRCHHRDSHDGHHRRTSQHRDEAGERKESSQPSHR